MDDDTDRTLSLLQEKLDAALLRVALVENRATSLEHFLYGDREAIEKFKKAVEGYVTPRGTEPTPGFVSIVNASLGGLQGSVERLITKLGIADRLEKFLGPLDISNAPLDGVQVATKSFVDAGIERIAGALRREIDVAIQRLRGERAEDPAKAYSEEADHKLLNELRAALPVALIDRRMSFGGALRWLWDRELRRESTCPKCGAVGDEPCVNKKGKERIHHIVRLKPLRMSHNWKD